MEIIARVVNRITSLGEIEDQFKAQEKYYKFLGKEPSYVLPGDRVYLYHNDTIIGSCFYDGFEECVASREGNYSKPAFRLRGPYHKFQEPIFVKLPRPWRFRYVNRVSGLRQSLDKYCKEN